MTLEVPNANHGESGNTEQGPMLLPDSNKEEEGKGPNQGPILRTHQQV